MNDKQINDADIVAAETTGWPLWLVNLSDLLSEGLPVGEREQFRADLRQAVPAGVDLNPVQYRIAIARHERSIARLAINPAPYAQQCIGALKSTIYWCRAELSGMGSEGLRSAVGSAALEAAESAESAMWAVAEWSAARSAMYAARSAGWSVLSAARSALWAVRSALWASQSTVHAEYQAERDALLSALRNMRPDTAREGKA